MQARSSQVHPGTWRNTRCAQVPAGKWQDPQSQHEQERYGDVHSRVLDCEGKVRVFGAPLVGEGRSDGWALLDLSCDECTFHLCVLFPFQVEEFMYHMLLNKHGIHGVIVEFGYNLIEALKQYRYDPDCDMFLRILDGSMQFTVLHTFLVASRVVSCTYLYIRSACTSGTLSEEVYQEQAKLVSSTLSFFRNVDLDVHGGRKTGKLRKSELINSLREHLPAKKHENILKLLVVSLWIPIART